MWRCTRCAERLEERFDACWNCGTSRGGVEDPSFRKADDIPAEGIGDWPASPAVSPSEASPDDVPDTAIRSADRELPPRASERVSARRVDCKDCKIPMVSLGKIFFMRQSDSVWLGLIATLTERDASNLEPFPIDVYRCSGCCRLELYDLDRSLPEPRG